MELPRALAPWGPMLDLFPRDLALPLGELLRRLDTAVGPLPTAGEMGEGEPNGFDGLERRGTYERLLLSEWLLADEVPDEFLRRAVMAEHGFLRQAFMQPAGNRICTTLLDVGPSQWGAPRVAQLAALVVLCRRAEAAGAPLYWATVQQEPHPAGLRRLKPRPEAFEEFLNSRSLHEVREERIRGWETVLAEKAEGDEAETWWMGGGKLRRLVERPGARCFGLWLEDAPDPQERRVVVEIRKRAQVRRLELELPEEPIAIRLLRNPFERVSPVVRGTGSLLPVSRPLFTHDRLVARAENGEFLSYAYPSRPGAQVGRPKRYRLREPEHAVAVGRLRRYPFVVSGREDRVDLLPIGPQSQCFPNAPCGVPLAPTPMEGDALNLALPMDPDPGRNAGFAFIDGEERLFLLSMSANGWMKCSVPAGRVVALAPGVVNGILYAEDSSMVGGLTRMAPGGETQSILLPFRPQQAYFGPGNGAFRAVAVGAEGEEWHVLFNDRFLPVPCTHRAVGVAAGIPQAGRLDLPALFFLNEEGRVGLLAPGAMHLLPLQTAPIRHVALHPSEPLLAYITHEGEVGIYSLTAEQLLCRWLPEEMR